MRRRRAARQAAGRYRPRPCWLLSLLPGLVAIPGCGDGAGPTAISPGLVQPPPVVEPPPVVQPSPDDVAREVGAWLGAHAKPFGGSHLSLPHTELDFLREVVGDARVVALGENTHGTRDFFEMKARILRFLVEEMGFNTFAIEATWPESRRLDHYVRTGEGDPRVLLSGLYFWTWNTVSVLEMIEWMRAHNEAGGDVGFHGFDMQYPGMALHNVREFVRTVDVGNAEAVANELDCLARFANGPDGRRERVQHYGEQSAAYWADCRASLEAVRERLLANRDEYEVLAGEDAFEVALQSLRVAFQYHLMRAEEQDRDRFMAENTVWISRRIGPAGRMVLWAHNNHVATRPRRQGQYLRQTFGDDMVVVGFSHETGQFSGVDLRPGAEPGYGPHDLEAPVADSYESLFAQAEFPRFVLHLRNHDLTLAGASWLGEERRFRSIGCCLLPHVATWFTVPLAEWYDVIIHFETTGPTTVLERHYPESW